MWEKHKQYGFTLVELLIVIAVIAILAVMASVFFVGIQNKTHDSSVQHALDEFAKKYEIYKVSSPSGLYPVGNAQLGELGIKVTNKNSYDTSVAYNLLNCASSPAGMSYALLAISKSGKKFYTTSTSGGVMEYTGSTPWGDLAMCSSVLPSSTANGAGYAFIGGWRSWTN
jgi:prepilin-type N-terminal cleavage/methylation domain-containing protein